MTASSLKKTGLGMEKLTVNTIRGVLALALATPLVIVIEPLPAVMFPFVVGKALYFRMLVEVALFLWLPLLLWYPAYRPPRSWLLGLVGVYVAIALLASFTGVGVGRSLWSNYERMQGWFGLIHYAAFTVMVASVFRTFRAWRGLLNCNLLIGLGVGALGLWEMTGVGTPTFLGTYELMFGEQRIGSSFENPSFLGAYASVNAVIAAGFLAHALATPRPRSPKVSSRQGPRSRQKRAKRRFGTDFLMAVFWAAAMALNLLMLFQSGTRGAVIGLVAGAGLVLLYYAVRGEYRAARLTVVFLISVGIVLIAGFYLLQSNEVFSTWSDQNLLLQRLARLNLAADSSVRARLYALYAGFEGFKVRPLLGWGPEQYSVVYDRYVTEYAVATSFLIRNFDQAHNRVVEELVTTGLIGLAGYLAIWCCTAWILIRRSGALPAHEQLFVLCVGAALAGYFVQNLFLFDTPGTVVQLYLLIGFAVYLETTLTRKTADLTSMPSPDVATHAEFRERTGSARPWTKTVLATSANIVVLLGFYFTVLGPYAGSRHAYAVLTGSRAWNERFAFMDAVVDAAPALAAQPLMAFMEQIVQQWNVLTPAERRQALALAHGAGASASAREPWEWRIHATLARIYQMASLTEPAYVTLARDHTDQAQRIAPHRSEILQLQAQQHVFEGDVAAALSVIDAYFTRTAAFLDQGSEVHYWLTQQRQRITELE